MPALRLAPLVAVLALAAPGSAHAASVAFDDQSDGQEISIQYAAQGLTFITQTPWYDPSVPATADTQTGVFPKVRGDFNAFTPPNVGDISGCVGEFCAYRAQAWGKFDVPQTDLSLHVGDFGAPGEGMMVSLASFDLDGNPIDVQSDSVMAGGGYGTTLVNHSGGSNIAYFQVRAAVSGHDHIAIDNVEFSRAVTAPPPTPSFALARSGPNLFQLAGLAPGTSRTAPLIVYRYGGSHGPVAFDFPGLPSDLEASVEPNPADPGDGGTVSVRIAAKPTAKAAIGAPVTVRARAVVPATAGTSTPQVTIPVNVLAKARLHISGMEVTQGVQEDLLNPPGTGGTISPDAGLPEPTIAGGPARYDGVKLVEARKTIVRVFANTGPGGAKLTTATVSLTGTGPDGKPLPGSPLLPEFSPPAVNFGGSITAMAERVNPAGAFVFTLPASWTHRTLALKAEATLSGLLAGASEGVVAEGGAFSLTGIPFTGTGGWELSPYVGLIKGLKVADPYSVYAAARAAMPFADGHLTLPVPTKVTMICPPVTSHLAPECRYSADPTSTPYKGAFNLNDIVDCSYSRSFFAHGCDDRGDATKDAMDRLQNHEEDNYDVGDTSVLVVPGPTNSFGGLTRTDEDTALKEEYPLMVITPLQGSAKAPTPRGLSDAAHELGHSMGRAHAGQGCKDTGPGDDQEGTPWPPDDQGLIQGVGIDPRPASGGKAGPYMIFAQDWPTVGKRWFDLMSYCALGNDLSNWLSTRYWNELVDLLAARTPHFASVGRARAAAAAPPKLSVWASVRSDGSVQIEPLRPAIGRVAVTEGGATSALHVVGRGAGGGVLFDSAMEADIAHVDETGKRLVAGKLAVPATGLQSIDITAGGRVLATRARSAHPPTVRVLAPRRGAFVGRKRTIAIRWRARDADGNPLLVNVDYSTDDGRHWRNVYVGANHGRVSLASSFFSGSRRARVRIRVFDGWDTTAAISSRFRAAGSPPGVVIDTPGSGQSFRSDAALYLSGEGYSDAFRPLRGRALTWFDGKRLIGHGGQVATQGLRAGRHRIRLAVRDHRGRRSSATVIVRILPARVRFRLLRVPRLVSRRGRLLRLRIAATGPAVLRVGGRRFAVDRRVRTVTLRIRPGRRTLSLAPTLVSGPYRTSVALAVARG